MSIEDPVPSRMIAFAEPEIVDRDIEAVTRVLRSGWLTTGAECEALETELSAHMDGAQVVSLASGTAALETALAYLDLDPGARVGVPTWTFAATALAAVRHGSVPVLLDIDARTLNLSPSALADALDAGLDALVPVHFGGVPVAAEIHSQCQDAGIPVIEDAAHAFGAVDHRGRVAGQGSVAACLSFYATKNVTCAEGGALVTQDSALASFARTYRFHGLTTDAWVRDRGEPAYNLTTPGAKANMPDVLAALARSQLSRADDIQARRRQLVNVYRDHLGERDDIGIVPLRQPPGSADHLLVVLLPEETDRARVVRRLDRDGIQTSVHFRPLHHMDWFRDHAELGPGGTPVADQLAGRALSLPLHLGLGEHDVTFVCDRLVEALPMAQRSR